MLPGSGLLALALASACAFASPIAVEERLLNVGGYAPSREPCPSTPLVRAASDGVAPDEAAWVSKRYAKATSALKTWLARTDKSFPTLADDQYPTIGLVDGGGGLRGFFVCAGFHKAYDINEPVKTAFSGLYQAITYETGLSGSADSLYSYAGNNWPLTSKLQEQLWIPSAASGINNPDNGSAVTLATIQEQVLTKAAAGFEITLLDVWARYLSYAFLLSADHGLGQHLSDLTSLSRFADFDVPYPIVTSLGIEKMGDGCGLPPKNASQYEFTPHEFGSWEKGIDNFMRTKYIGTAMNAGKPVVPNTAGPNCVTGFDNMGWVMATSTNTFNQICGTVQDAINGLIPGPLLASLRDLFRNILGTGIRTLYSIMPNPFFGLDSAPLVSKAADLFLIDGGETYQVPPIWPFLYRPEVDTLIISDNSADNPANYRTNDSTTVFINYPSGEQIWNTYTQAKANNVQHRMPAIPNPTVFMQKNLNKKPMTFFGCNQPADSPQMMFLYLPNREVVYNTDFLATDVQTSPYRTRGTIDNGVAIATNNGDPQFATCVACGLMKRSALKAGKKLPAACSACFTKYCFN